MSRTFQHVKMIPDMTVLENVALGAHLRGSKNAHQGHAAAGPRRRAPPAARGRRQLERIGMGDAMHELAGNLAMGPQRLLEIARALCSDPALLLLDEPAAGLRHKEKQALAGVLRSCAAKA
jgi:branched-chain amino acid transport system permease protein